MEKGAKWSETANPIHVFSPKCFSFLMPETFVLEVESHEGGRPRSDCDGFNCCCSVVLNIVNVSQNGL